MSTLTMKSSAVTLPASLFETRKVTSTTPGSDPSTNTSRETLTCSTRTWTEESVNEPEKTSPV